MMKLNDTQFDQLVGILQQIVTGTHDPMPTRRMYFQNKEAMQVDEWWQDYFTNNDQSLKMLAKRALNVMYNIREEK